MKRFFIFLLVTLLVFSFSGCGKDSAPEVNEDTFRVITSFYPVYVTTLNLVEGAENVSLINLTETDYGCMHNYTLTTEDMKRMTGADLFIASGMNMEAFVGKNSLGIPRLELLDSGEDISKVIEDEHGENPHYWMNIENAIEQCRKIERALKRCNPENAQIYEKNSAEYVAKLNALLEEANERCAKIKKKDMIIFHDSFDYFAEEFGFNAVKLLSGHNGTAPSPKEIAETVEYMKEKNIDTVYVQEDFTANAAIKTIKKETDCSVAELNTLTSGRIDENTKDAYINAIYHNLEVLEETMGK